MSSPSQQIKAANENGDDAGTVAVVIPTYNERENIQALVPRILVLGERYRVIVVDDSSPDGTGTVADGLAAQHPGRISVVHRPRKQGIGRAYIAGFHVALASDAAYIVEMDADLSHSPDTLPEMVAIASSADAVLGSRYVRGGRTVGWPIHRRAISRLGGQYARVILGVPIADLTSGYKVFSRAALEHLDLGSIRSDGYGFQIETTYRLLRSGARVIEVPITFTDRVAGASKLSRRIVIEAFFMVWRLRLDRSPVAPLRTIR